MIITIAFSIIFLLAIIVLIYSIIEDDISIIAIFSIFFSIILNCAFVFGLGYSKSHIDLTEKQIIETALEDNPTLEVIEKAQEYNADVNVFNNYFFRFTIEDRSEYLIDINKYLEDLK